MTSNDSTSIPQLALKPADAAKALAISERTLWTLTQEGKFRTVKVGRQTRYLVSQLQEDLLRQQSGMVEESTVG